VPFAQIFDFVYQRAKAFALYYGHLRKVLIPVNPSKSKRQCST
jgi:hypothetical protein